MIIVLLSAGNSTTLRGDCVNLKRLAVWLLALSLLFITASCAVRADEWILPGQCLNYSYVNASNESVNVTFCANVSIAPNCTAYNFTSLNLSLDSGQSSSGNGSWNFYDAVCRAPTSNYSGGVCSFSRNLDSGEDYLLNDSACQLDLSCAEGEVQDCSGLSTQYFGFTIRNNVTDLSVEYDNRTQVFPNLRNISYSFEVERQCPAVNASEGEAAPEYLDLVECANLLAVSNKQAYGGLVTVANVLNTSYMTASSAVSQLGGAQETATRCTTELDFCREGLSQTEKNLAVETARADDLHNSFVLLLGFVVVVILACFGAYIWGRLNT